MSCETWLASSFINDGMFIQMLDGEKNDSEFIFEKIKKNERHIDIKVFSSGPSV